MLLALIGRRDRLSTAAAVSAAMLAIVLARVLVGLRCLSASARLSLGAVARAIVVRRRRLRRLIGGSANARTLIVSESFFRHELPPECAYERGNGYAMAGEWRLRHLSR